MTKSKAITLLRSGIFNILRIASILYNDPASIETKRNRLVQRLRRKNISDEEVEMFERLLY